MGLMDGKTALIFGVANERSIAWGIAKAFHDQGAKIGSPGNKSGFGDEGFPQAKNRAANSVGSNPRMKREYEMIWLKLLPSGTN